MVVPNLFCGNKSTTRNAWVIQSQAGRVLEDNVADVFISYSRKDKEFVQRLHAALLAQKRETWVDWQDILPTEKWWKAIESGIEAAEAFVFIISPDSASSEICIREIDHAVEHHKRLIPILHRETDLAKIHPALNACNWLFMRDSDDFDRGVDRLIETIDTDIKYVRTHTRLLVRAVEWEQEGRDNSFLLRGRDLSTTEQWLKQGVNKRPTPTPLQIEYITASRELQYRRPRLRNVFLVSGAVGIAVLLVRLVGVLSPLELFAYDHFITLRPDEPQDETLLIVAVDEQASQQLDEQYGFDRSTTLPAPALSALLTKLQAAQPRVIGIDFFRSEASQGALSEQLRADNLVAVCKSSETDSTGQIIQNGIKPPPEISQDRFGFGDFIHDRGKVIRRYVVDQPNDSTFCDTNVAFSLRIAQQYLESAGQPYQPLTAQEGDYFWRWRWGKASFQRLDYDSGYQYLDIKGYQLLLNYRAYENDPARFAPLVSMNAVLDGRVSEEQIRDRIVLIGSTDQTDPADFWGTPYGSRQIPGVTLQGQMISQMVNAVLYGRPTIWWLPVYSSAVWVVGWAIVGGLIVWRFQKLPYLGGAVASSFIGLYLICYVVFTFQGGWLPLIPGAIALIGAELAVGCLTYRLRKSW